MRNELDMAPTTKEELRAKVETAKELYRAQKDAYRQERARRREKERLARGEISLGMQPSTSDSSREPIEVPASYGTPKRAHTHIGHGSRHQGYRAEDMNARAQNRITKKLADMGFTENSHPLLSEKIAVLLLAGDGISKDREDDIVTTLLEELIPASPNPSQAASGRKNDIPGAWQFYAH